MDLCRALFGGKVSEFHFRTLNLDILQNKYQYLFLWLLQCTVLASVELIPSTLKWYNLLHNWHSCIWCWRHHHGHGDAGSDWHSYHHGGAQRGIQRILNSAHLSFCNYFLRRTRQQLEWSIFSIFLTPTETAKSASKSFCKAVSRTRN